MSLANNDLKDLIINSSVLINATNISKYPYEDKSPIDTSFLRSDLTVADVIYSPSITKLLQAAQDKGCNIINGEGMLLYQGFIAFEIWTGVKSSAEVMLKSLKI